MKKKLLAVLFVTGFMLTGCFKSDNMDGIKVKTTVYPIEYITTYLFGENASMIGSIYPDGINLSNYKLTEKQINDFSNNDLFIYNGASNEPDYAIELLNINKKIKIIDAAQGMEYSYSTEELWLDPFNFLMLAQNIKTGFADYIEDPYLNEKISKKYDKLNLEVSALDVELKEAAEHAVNKTIVVSDDAFKYLEKYGITVISLEENENLNNKSISDAKKLINNKTIEYIFVNSSDGENDTVKNIAEQTGVTIVPLHSLSIISEEERNENNDYLTIMKENIEKIRKELYK